MPGLIAEHDSARRRTPAPARAAEVALNSRTCRFSATALVGTAPAVADDIRMTRALEYAALPATPPLGVGRLMLWLVYYAGWAGGWAVLGLIGAVMLLETGLLSRRWVSHDEALASGPLVGAALGALLAVLARRRRWPQAVLGIVGGLASVPLACVTWSIYGGRRPMGWDALALLIYCILLAGSLSFLFSGTAGLLLNRRTAR
jgi:hypothetical protein